MLFGAYSKRQRKNLATNYLINTDQDNYIYTYTFPFASEENSTCIIQLISEKEKKKK